MTSPEAMVRTATCPGCGAKLQLRADQSGKKIQCGGCGKRMRVPVFGDASATPEPPKTPPPPESVTFSCSLCETRITVPINGVGKKVKCPDCYRVNIVPPPPAPAKPRIPAAMSGDQYEVWGVDEAPLSADMLATQEKLYAVPCRLCQTLMYVAEAQLGSELECPDCCVKTVATKPKSTEVVRPAEDDGGEYELDETSAPMSRPTVVPVAIREAERLQAARDDPETVEGRKRRKEKLDARDRPIMPKVPLVSGVLRMLLTSEVFSRGVLAGLYLAGVAAIFASVLGNLGGGGGRFGGGMGAIAAICFGVGGVILGTLWYGLASAQWLAVLTESAEGHDELYAPPNWNFMEWAGEAFYLLMSVSVGCVPAWLAWKASFAAPTEVRIVLSAAAWLLAFPVAILSALHEGSPMGVISPRLLSSFIHCPGQWLLFYLESGLFAAGFGLAAVGLAQFRLPVVTISLLFVAAMFLYMRLIGRLGWWLAEAMPEEEDDESE